MKPTILIVEDDDPLRENLEEFLAMEGYCAIAMSSAADAITALHCSYFDAIVCDIRMEEDCAGYLVLEAARSFGRHTPFIFVSAKAFPRDREDGMKAGADCYLIKPFAMGELLSAIKALIG